MAEIYLPPEFIISNVQVSHYTPNFFNESLSLIPNSASRGIHRLEGSLNITCYDEAAKRKLDAFYLKASGRLNPFHLSLGGRFSSVTVTGNITLNQAASVGANKVNIKTFAGSISEGDFFTFPNDKKVYTFMQDKVGAGDVAIFPALRQPQSAGAIIDTSDVKPYIRLTGDRQKIDYDNSTHESKFQWVETLT